MSSTCFGTINACRLRVTRLDADGSPTGGVNGGFISDALVDVTATLVTVAAVEKSVINGCGCECLSYTSPARNKRFDITINLCTWDPQLVELLTGSDLILNGSDDPIGWWWQYAESCGDFTPPAVAIETWSDRRLGGAALASPEQYEQWLFPGNNFVVGNYTLGADFAVPSFVGTGFANPEWGEGPYGDQPETAGAIGGAWTTDTLPDASCAYTDVVVA